jgi:pantetheine-phosphate adenylyltransferase
MSLKKALYAGSFDPFTNGHLDIVNRALKIFDELTIVIAISPSKKSFFDQETKIKLLKKIFRNEPRVKIDFWGGLLVDYAKKNQIKSVVRGLRPTGDFEIEFQMASMNRKLVSEIETIFLMTGENLYYISSSLVKEVYGHGGDIKEFVPLEIYEELMARKGV